MLRNLTPDQVRTHRDVILLDASKLAAIKIDQSYSFFGKLDQSNNVSFYRGIFLGAERIEAGDTLRVVPPKSLSADSIVYFGVSGIKLEVTPSGRCVSLGGTFYQLQEVDNGRIATVPDDRLPRALKEESLWRKSIAPEKPLTWSTPIPDQWLTEADIKGRFYPTHLLSPILDPKKFAEATRERSSAAAMPALNGRLDSSTAETRNVVGWRTNRMATAGQSIPHGSMFWFEAYVQEESGVQ